MTTLVATADSQAPARFALIRTAAETIASPSAMTTDLDSTIDCPACGLPAVVEWRDTVAGTSGPVVHMKVRCPIGRHWFLMPEDGLSPPEAAAGY